MAATTQEGAAVGKPVSAPRGLAAQRIRPGAGSKRTPVNEFQARHFAHLIRALEQALLAHYRAPSVDRLPADRFEEAWALDEYRLFCEGAYACGFVCNDFKPDGPLDAAKARPEATIAGWDFFTLRHYIHTLLRAEKWADGYSSPILDAVICGALHAVADRLDTDESLNETL